MGSSQSHRLWQAAKEGNLIAMEECVRQGADINYQTKDMSVLQVACAAGKHDAVAKLVAFGAVDRPNRKLGNTALHVAAGMGHQRVVALLLERGADHWHQNKQRLRPVEYAGRRGQVDVVRQLEQLTCPFLSQMEVKHTGFMSSWKSRWCAITRARPADPASIDRSAVYMEIFKSQASPISDELLDLQNCIITIQESAVHTLPVPAHVAVTFQVQHKKRHSRTMGRVLFRCNGATYTWFRNVVDPRFASGSGPAFNDDGTLVIPQGAQHGLAGIPVLSVASQRSISSRSVAAAAAGAAMPPGYVPSGGAGQVVGVAVAAAVPPHRVAATVAMGTVINSAVGASNDSIASSSNSLVMGEADEEEPDYEEHGFTLPSYFCCPITYELMLNPVVAADGHSYEYSAIASWLQQHRTSPKTNQAMADRTLRPNHALRAQIIEWKEQAQATIAKRQAQALEEAAAKRLASTRQLAAARSHAGPLLDAAVAAPSPSSVASAGAPTPHAAGAGAGASIVVPPTSHENYDHNYSHNSAIANNTSNNSTNANGNDNNTNNNTTNNNHTNNKASSRNHSDSKRQQANDAGMGAGAGAGAGAAQAAQEAFNRTASPAVTVSSTLTVTPSSISTTSSPSLGRSSNSNSSSSRRALTAIPPALPPVPGLGASGSGSSSSARHSRRTRSGRLEPMYVEPAYRGVSPAQVEAMPDAPSHEPLAHAVPAPDVARSPALVAS